MKLSAIILTKNEEKNIKDSLVSLRFCDEIIVIDDYSSDKTTEIAKSLGSKIYKRELKADFSKQRNFGLAKASGDWVLFLDPDERISKDLSEEILDKIKNKNINGYFFKRYDYLWGKKIKHGEIGTLRILRLAKRSAGRWARSVHEFWQINGKISTLKNPILHYPHQSLSEFISRINFFSDLHAKANFKEGKRSNLVKIIFWPIAKFIYGFFFKFGFMDGEVGFVVAIVMSMHSFLAWSKLWVYQNQKS